MRALLSAWLAVAVASVGLSVLGSAVAATIHVTTTGDELDFVPNSNCSLREAIVTVNEQRALGVGGCTVVGPIGSNDVIVVPAGTYVLTRLGFGGIPLVDQDADNLDVLADVTIRGAGASRTIIDGSQIYLTMPGEVRWPMYEGGVMRIGDGVVAAVEGVALRGGSALYGGGVHVGGTLTLARSAVENNHTTSAGGGIFNKGTLTLRQVTISNNAGINGEGLDVSSGGGIFNSGSLDAENVTVSGNSASVGGGLSVGVNSPGETLLDSVTITNNEGLGNGRDFTLAPAGGVYTGTTPVRIINSIVAGNRMDYGNPDCGGSFDSRGYNLIGDVGSCTGFTINDLRGNADSPIDPLLAPLANYGGGTLTHALLAGSPAIDGGPLPITGDCPDTDQRGFDRGIDGDGNGFVQCDIGAFEMSGGANLDISLRAEPNPVEASGALIYRVTLRNHGPDDAFGVVYQVTVPAEAGPITSVPPACGASGSTVTCNVGPLNAGFNLIGSVGVTAPSVPGVVIAQASVTSESLDLDPTDDTAEVPVLVVGANSADLALAMSGPSNVIQGASFEYLLTASNAGPNAADQSAAVTNFLPQNVTLLAPPTGCTVANNMVRCPVPGLAAGTSQEFVLSVRAPTQPGHITNTASIAGAGGSDTNTANNSASLSTRVDPPQPPQADLFIQKNGPSTAQTATEVTYNLVVHNNGPEDAENVRLTDTLPAGMVALTLPPECSAQGQEITCDLGPVPAFGATRSYAVVVTAPDQAGVLVNSASIADLGASVDPHPQNNESSVTTTVTEAPPPPGADLALSKSGPPQVLTGTAFSYALVVTNNGPDPALNVRLTDVLPAELTVAEVSDGCSLSGRTATCLVAELAAGASASFSIGVVAPSTETTVTNTANATSDVVDAVPNNDSAAVSTVVVTEVPEPVPTLVLAPQSGAPSTSTVAADAKNVVALRFSAEAGASESVNLESLTLRAAGSAGARGVGLVQLFVDDDADGAPDGPDPLASGTFDASSNSLLLVLPSSGGANVGAGETRGYVVLVDLAADAAGLQVALLALLALLPIGLWREARRVRLLALVTMVSVVGLISCNTAKPPGNDVVHQLVIDAATATGAESGTAAQVTGTPLHGAEIEVRE